MSDRGTDEEIYQGQDRKWSGRPNASLVDGVAGLPPGRALDLGCGEGADAIWLALQGWTVTGADISATALERAATDAQAAGVAGRVDWRQGDLVTAVPGGPYDLVSAQYLHSRGVDPGVRVHILRAAAALVAAGGVLFVVGHTDLPGHADPAGFPHAGELLAQLSLDAPRWEVLLAEDRARTQTGPEGQPMEFSDSVVKLRRLSEGAVSVGA
ncbi:MAG TPA: class I SAM-dependent methyltransferase [Streptosporangiaceae bacterium]|jgi:SAM-dependent methyltransferase